MQQLTMRQRMLNVFRGGELDRVPFVQYDGISAPNSDIWQVIGRENMGILRWCGVHRFEHPNCRFDSQEYTQDGLRAGRTILTTPKGTLTEEKLFEPALGSAATRKHFVTRPADYEILLSFLRDITVVQDLTGVRQAIAELGEDGLPLVAVARTPYQQLWIQWVCIEDLALHLVDHPELLEECTRLLGDIERRICDVAVATLDKIDLPFIDFPDNITAPVIGERYFRRYCLPHYRYLADRLRGRNTGVIVHMDGDLQPLAKAIAETPLCGLDSFSPQPDNDTTVAEAVRLWPNLRLMVNFPSSVHLGTPDTIYRQALRILEEGGHTRRLWIQVSENTPPQCWRKSYPEIVRAIRDFGKP